MNSTDSRSTRSVGEFVKSGSWDGYWSTSISRAANGRIWVRGYPLEEVVEQLSYPAAMWLLLRGEVPTEREEVLWELSMKIALDQQFINSAVGAARFVASAHPESPIPGLAAGILAHGSVTGSPRPTGELIYEVLRASRDEGQELRVAAVRQVEARLGRGESIPGFGHPMHKSTEPRAALLKRRVVEMGAWGESGAAFDEVHRALESRLERTIPPNLAGVLGSVYCELGFTPIEMEALAALGYGYAIVAHVVEEIREGVPLRIIPDALGARYTGPDERHLPKGQHPQESRSDWTG